LDEIRFSKIDCDRKKEEEKSLKKLSQSKKPNKISVKGKRYSQETFESKILFVFSQVNYVYATPIKRKP
jgi:hypothetical protein